MDPTHKFVGSKVDILICSFVENGVTYVWDGGDKTNNSKNS